MGVRSTNTMSEGLQSVLQDISTMKVMPDADLEWLINLETQVVEKLREPFSQNPGGSPSPGGQTDFGGQIGATPNPGPGGVPGQAVRNGPPNPDELRRLLG